MYQVFEVPKQKEESIETLGTKPKFWFSHGGIEYLWKESRTKTGEHWSEKISCELCRLIGLPHAHYELARYKGKKGVVSPNFIPNGATMTFGNQLLVERQKEYPVTRFYKVKEHSLSLVLRILGFAAFDVKPPIGWIHNSDLDRGVEIFIGYLMLDAWIGNQDRHYENWGLIRTKERKNHLAPTYDHASSLGRNESDKKRLNCLHNRGRDNRLIIESYVERAKSAFYSSGQNQRRWNTIESFQKASLKYKKAATFWIKKIKSVSNDDVQLILSNIPGTEISEPAVDFAREFLKLNRDRILDIERALK
jgi:hypothetical protein